MSDLPPDVCMMGDRVLVSQDELPKQTTGGIHIPDTVEVEIDALRTGIVVAVGPGLQTPDGDFPGVPLMPDERVVFHKRVGIGCALDGVPYKIMGARDVVMTIGLDVELHKIMARVKA